jgi:integral membrane protein (TIGR00529 family)
MDAVYKILIVFAIMLGAVRFKCPLGISLIFGGIALNLWGGISLIGTFVNLTNSFASLEMWLLLVVTMLIVEIARFMTVAENSDEIVGAAQRWGGRHGRAASLMTLPAVIGLVPMPAGALFSAPLVEQASGDVAGDNDWKAAINYWFRHVWEYWWPLYPGVIIAMAIFEMDAWRFMSVQFPFTIMAVGSGFLFLIRPHIKTFSALPANETGSNKRALFLFLPLVIVIITILVLPQIYAHILPDVSVLMRKLLALLTGLLIAMIPVFIDERQRRIRTGVHGSGMFSTLFKPKSIYVFVTLMGVLVFKFLLNKSGLLSAAGNEIIASGIPPAIAVAALPFLAGFVTGIALGFTGVAFPLVVGLMAAEGSGLTPLATLVLAYGFGYMGMMLSPVHLCLLVTRDYFDSSLKGIYLYILPCAVSVLALSLILYATFTALGI